MTFQLKNNNLAIAALISMSTMMIAAAAQADPNPYFQNKLIAQTKVAPVSPINETVQNKVIQEKINVVKPATKVPSSTSGKEPYVKEGPIFVKDGGKLPLTNPATNPSNTGINQSFVKEGPIFVKDGGKLPLTNPATNPSRNGINQSFVKEGPIFVKDGGKLPLTNPDINRSNNGINQSFIKEGPIFVKDGGKLPGTQPNIRPNVN